MSGRLVAIRLFGPFGGPASRDRTDASLASRELPRRGTTGTHAVHSGAHSAPQTDTMYRDRACHQAVAT